MALEVNDFDPLAQSRKLVRDLTYDVPEYGRHPKFVKKVVKGIERVYSFIDSLTKEAVKRSKEFLPFYNNREGEKDKLKTDYSLVRSYKNPETQFLFESDQLAPDSIVVTRSFYFDREEKIWKKEACKERIYWVSPKRDPETHFPFVYRLTEKDKRVHAGTGDVAIPDYQASLVKLSREYATTNAQTIFNCSDVFWRKDVYEINKGGRKEIEVWKKGSVNKQKVRDPERNVSTLYVGQLEQQPVAI